MLYGISLIGFVQSFLPTGSKIIELESPYKRPAVIMADLDGDGAKEIIAAYKWQGETYVIVLKEHLRVWFVMDNIKGTGYNVTYLNAAPITSRNINNLIIGWQMGSIWSQLDILQWTRQGFKHIIPNNIYYSKIEVEDMPGVNGRDGIYEIALWVHDTGDAYKIEVYRWNGKGLAPSPDVYLYYFRRVVEYYKQKVKEMPGAAFYWYYLADAQFKAGMLCEALDSINVTISLGYEYPSKEDVMKLKEEILLKLKSISMKLFPASIRTVKGVKWGYINNRGTVIIKFQYNSAEDFQDNGLAVAQPRDLYGIINKCGKYVVEPKYSSINKFSEGRAIVIDSKGFKVIDEEGNEITSKAYNYISDFKEGRAVFANSDNSGKYTYGYLDKGGKEVIPAKFESASDFKDGKAVVKIKDGEFGLIGTWGQLINKYNYNFVGNFGDGLLAFQKGPQDRYGYINEKGEIIIPPQYAQAQAFSQGRAVVDASEDYINKYGLIDKRGNYILNPEYNDINYLGEMRIAVGKAIVPDKPYRGSKYAIADLNGNIFTDFIYYDVSSYRNGLASSGDYKSTFFIDKHGKVVKMLPIVNGSGTLSLEDYDVVKANIDFRISYLNKRGMIIWQQNKIVSLNNKYAVIEGKYKPNRDYLVYYPQIKGMDNKIAEEEANKKLKELSQIKPIESNILLDYNYVGDFSIEFFKKQLLVLEIDGYQYYYGAAHGMPSKIYPHVDLVSGRFYELKDLFKRDSDYVKVLSKIIGDQIKNNEEYSYIFPGEYKGIKADQPFYVNEDALYIYFYPYEIAPYAAGFPTFKIPYKEIANIINTQGDFWRSFHY
ncbi:WG repeat-containing protein [Clostridium lundense]|uniref:WG repeat-containing protein n=1 Tax=Clostridium lundense TaxID=319475 RepID=UPI0006871ADE|nr:WG repeat-containing protein [Clostridium lundense]